MILNKYIFKKPFPIKINYCRPFVSSSSSSLKKTSIIKLSNEIRNKLIEESKKVRLKAYSPYSNFKVGAALLGTNGEIYVGCNVENLSYGLTNCAERTAIFRMVSEGHTSLAACIVSTETGTSPCGACRQVMSEFCQDRNIPILMVNTATGEVKEYTMDDLLPERIVVSKDLDN